MATPYDNFSFDPTAVGGDAGVGRVNADTANTGTVAYKDNTGQTVLTNVAVDSTGKQTKIGAEPTPPNAIPSPSTTGSTPTYANTPDVRSSLFSGLSKLRTSTNAGEASALYDSLMQSLTSEMARVETEAQTFAQSKYSVPELQKQLEAARQADRADKMWSPGMGDSPITQGIMTEMRMAGESARADSQSYLKTNIAWTSLSTLKTQADKEMQRIEKIQDSADRVTLNKQLSQDTAHINADYSQQIRAQDRADRRNEEALAKFNALSSTQIHNISILAADQIGGLQDGSEEKKIRVSELAFGNKDKNFVAAVSAEEPVEKLSLALQGNPYARKLLVTEESARLGISTDEVNKKINDLTLKLADPKMPRRVIQAMEGNVSKREEMLAQINAGRLDLTKKAQVDNMKVSLLLRENQTAVQSSFENDVSTWRVADPALQVMLTSALDKSRKIAGKSDIKNVVAAFLDDGPDEQRLQRANMFSNAIDMAAMRYQGSAFGQPSSVAAKALIVKEGVAQGWFTRAVKAMQNTNDAMKYSNPIMAPFNVGNDLITAASPGSK